ncbi:xylanase A [Fusarium mexicanum]|uniref:Xylanase A n=1 Tax=Fusarium mexicanum TaxID=751941 RepID=A0A8H5JRT5_9HYPO|nr:xylanase A [Fusarium mexicanum]
MLNNEDSGINGFTVTWAGSDTVISGGYEISNWTEGDNGIWSAPVPKSTKSRNLYDYDWIMKTPGIENGELRAVNSFIDRVAVIEKAGDRVLEMKRDIWANQLISYDQIAEPFWDGGVWIQNVKALLTDGGQFYLDRNESTVYYKPLEGEDMAAVSAYLGIEEVPMVVGGTYEEPVHDLHFEGITFKHSTWLKPDTYSFEALLVADAQRGPAGGIGIGNEKDAHLTGVGLRAHNIHINGNYFTQVVGNSITIGGIQADAHHPSQPKMLVSNIHASNNIFNNNSVLWSSTVPILFTYTQFSSITHNDIYNQPYSGICHGYGWGSNDEGGSPEYAKRDEASRNITWYNNLGFTSGKYDAPNDRIPEQLTGWNTVIDNWGKLGVKDNESLDGFPNYSGRRNNTFLRNYLTPYGNGTSLIVQRAAYRAGVVPSKRKGRPVTNDPDIADAYLDFKVSDRHVAVNVTNFDDLDFKDVIFHISGPGVTFTKSGGVYFLWFSEGERYNKSKLCEPEDPSI